MATTQIEIRGGGKRFDGIGVVNGGGATSVLLKDYPEPQRSQILDLVYKPKFGASVSALMIEIPGDGNATQGSMPSHMHTRDDLNYHRGYMWWLLTEVKRRNPKITLDGTAWSAPGWVGNGEFWSQDAVDYYVKWLQGLREVYQLEFDALGCRNEKGVSFEFAKLLRDGLDMNGFANVKLHAFDHWPTYKLDFVRDLVTNPDACKAIDILGAHVLASNFAAPKDVQELAESMGKPIWNTEEHVYRKGFDCAITVVKQFNDSYISSRATKIVNWYDIAAVYPVEPYAEDPAMLIARWPWCGHYRVREALWGYAHYGQFTEVGWTYVDSGCIKLPGGGSVVTLKSAGDDYSVIIETKGAAAPQTIRIDIDQRLSGDALCVWHSNESEQFVQLPSIDPASRSFEITVQPDCIYSLSTTRGQQKGSYVNIPNAEHFPFPYADDYDDDRDPETSGYLPRYMADIAGAFELSPKPDGDGQCLRQVVPIPTISWAPDWHPYTILGDENWTDYAVSVDIYLKPGDTVGLMGRINHVGTGYGFVPRGYYVRLNHTGDCQLVAVRGKLKKDEIVGDAEQQAIIKAMADSGEGGEVVLASTCVAGIVANSWHRLTLRFDGESIVALIDDQQVVSATNGLYGCGMVGLLAGGSTHTLSTPYFKGLSIKPLLASTAS